MGARLLGLVLNRHPNVATMLAAFLDALGEPSTLLKVVGLETVVIAVLARPNVDQIAAHLGRHVDDRLSMGDGGLADARILRREGALSPFCFAEDIGADRSDLETIAGGV